MPRNWGRSVLPWQVTMCCKNEMLVFQDQSQGSLIVKQPTVTQPCFTTAFIYYVHYSTTSIKGRQLRSLCSRGALQQCSPPSNDAAKTVKRSASWPPPSGGMNYVLKLSFQWTRNLYTFSNKSSFSYFSSFSSGPSGQRWLFLTSLNF